MVSLVTVDIYLEFCFVYTDIGRWWHKIQYDYILFIWQHGVWCQVSAAIGPCMLWLQLMVSSFLGGCIRAFGGYNSQLEALLQFISV